MTVYGKKDIAIHFLMCFVGGFMGAYALIIHAGNYASAQTKNMIDMIIALLGGNLAEVALRLLAVIVYFLGIALFVIIKNKTSLNPQHYALAVEGAAAVGVCFIPDFVKPVVAILPIFFMMATQWSAFHGTYGYTSSTIFSTNNLKQASSGLVEYLCNGDRKQLDKAKYFGSTILSFHIGVVAAYFACMALHRFSAAFCIVPICAAAYLIGHKSETTCPEREKVTKQNVRPTEFRNNV